jgi:NAD(P)-dependent dehydrogenase (short-subunit alcohol dehydrogenase family)
LAIVAGGAGLIGAATSRLLAAAGAAVAIVDKEIEAAERVAKDIGSSGGPACAVEADLRDEQACGDAIRRSAEALGGLDILANVAGGMTKHAQWRPLVEWTTDSWQAIMQINLQYVFWACRAAIPLLEARGGGTIVNVASIAGAFGSPNQSAYGAAKAGLVNLTETLAVECGPSGIRVNAVSPGVTLMDPSAVMSPERYAEMSSTTPLRKLGCPEDIAGAILFFASPMASHVTGQMLLVDGGISVNFPYHNLH